MKRGQISIEFMLLIVFILVFLGATVLPSLELSVATVRDVRGIAETRVAAEKIANTVESLKGQSTAAQETLRVIVPKNATISCCDSQAPTPNCTNPTLPTGIQFSYLLEGPETTVCNFDDDNPASSQTCTKKISVTTPMTCGTATGFPIQGPQTATVVITKNLSTTTVTRT